MSRNAYDYDKSDVKEERSYDHDYVEYMKTVIRGRKDPVWLVESEFGIELFPKQKEVMSKFYTENKKHMTLACGMRSGKSAIAGVMAAYEYWYLMTLPTPSLHYGLIKGQPINISIVSTSEKQAIDSIFTNVANMIEGSDFINTWTDTKVKGMEISSKQKSIIIRTLSSWSTTAVGRSNKCVVFDELANFEDTNGKRGAWEIYSRLAKSTDTFKQDGHVIAISSPKTPTDIIMTLQKRQIDQPNAISLKLPTWEMNPNFTKEMLMEEYKYDLPTFWRDFGCQPQAFSAIQFPEGVKLDTNMLNVFDYPPVGGDNHTRVMAIDPAVTSDAFGIACGYYDHNTDTAVIDGVTRFQKIEDQGYIKPSDIKKFIDEMIPKLNVEVFIFDTWMYPELIEYVDDELGIEVVKHIVMKEDYDRWREMQNSGSCRVVHDDVLKYEAEQLMVIKGAKPRTDHPFNGSKDEADCVANCMWRLKEAPPMSNSAAVSVCVGF